MGATAGHDRAEIETEIGPVKRSVRIAGHATSVSLEPEFWALLQEIAENRKVSLAALITEIDAGRGARNLSSACRVFVLQAVKAAGNGL